MSAKKEGIPESPEIISWLYHARELQIQAIAKEMRRALIEKIIAQSDDIRALNEILTTPLVFMTDNRRCVLFKEAMRGVRLMHTLEVIKSVFEQIGAAIAPEAPKVTSVGLWIESPLIKALEAAFPERDSLSGALIQGRQEASDIIMTSLQGDQPLLRFRKDMLSLATDLRASVDGGSVALLNTKVPGIKVRYYYPPGRRFPRRSLEVRRLDRA